MRPRTRGRATSFKRGPQPPREILANKSKLAKANKRKIAFICFHYFFRIGTFQWVTAEKDKKVFSPFGSRLRFCALFSTPALLSRVGCELGPVIGKTIAHRFCFSKEIRACKSRSPP